MSDYIEIEERPEGNGKMTLLIHIEVPVSKETSEGEARKLTGQDAWDWFGRMCAAFIGNKQVAEELADV